MTKKTSDPQGRTSLEGGENLLCECTGKKGWITGAKRPEGRQNIPRPGQTVSADFPGHWGAAGHLSVPKSGDHESIGYGHVLQKIGSPKKSHYQGGRWV